MKIWLTLQCDWRDSHHIHTWVPSDLFTSSLDSDRIVLLLFTLFVFLYLECSQIPQSLLLYYQADVFHDLFSAFSWPSKGELDDISENLDLFYTLEISCFPDSFGYRSQLCNKAEVVWLNLNLVIVLSSTWRHNAWTSNWFQLLNILCDRLGEVTLR